MGHRKAGANLPSFCLNRIRPPRGGVRPPSLRFQRKTANELDSDKTEQPKAEKEFKSVDGGGAAEESSVGGGGGRVEVGTAVGRKIMVVVDSTAEAKGALQWALTHTVQSQDTLILLHATKVSKQDKGSAKKKMAPRSYEFLHNMKKMCNNKRPEVQVEIAVVEGKEKGPTIVEEAKKQGVSMLVLGHKKKGSTTWRLLMMWAGSRVAAATTAGGGGAVEYCIQNADCMAIAVRRKSKKVGGYLITTKRHKDFWLLA